jgi:hypothetical protein
MLVLFPFLPFFLEAGGAVPVPPTALWSATLFLEKAVNACSVPVFAFFP